MQPSPLRNYRTFLSPLPSPKKSIPPQKSFPIYSFSHPLANTKCICQGSPEKEDQQQVIEDRREIGARERERVSNWLVQLWRLTNPKSCNQQAGSPRDLGVQFQPKSQQALETERADVSVGVQRLENTDVADQELLPRSSQEGQPFCSVQIFN